MTQLDQSQARFHQEQDGRAERVRRRQWEMLGASNVAAFARRLFPARREHDIDEVLALGANTAASLPACGRGLDVEVLEGSVLLTQSGDRDDHVLESGQRVRFFGPREVAAMAFKPSRVHIRAGAAAGTVTQSHAWNGATYGSSLR